MSNSTTTTKIYNARGQVCGQVLNGVFCWTGTNRHMLHKPPALALEVEVVTQLETLNVKALQFTNRETGVIYRAAFPHFLERAFPLNRGFGEQRGLVLTGWTRQARGGNRLAQLALPGGWF